MLNFNRLCNLLLRNKLLLTSHKLLVPISIGKPLNYTCTHAQVAFVEGLVQQLQRRVGSNGGPPSAPAAAGTPPPAQGERYTRPRKEEKSSEKPERKERSKRTIKPGDPGRCVSGCIGVPLVCAYV